MRRIILIANNYAQGVNAAAQLELKMGECSIITQERDLERLHGLEKHLVLLLPGYEHNYNVHLLHSFLRSRRFKIFEECI